MANKQTFFSQYRGRGGPAIEPGIIQMMGSIGDEYAKGITALGKGIKDARKAKEEQEKTEEANKLWTELLQGKKQIEDPEAYGEAIQNQVDSESLLVEEARIAESNVDEVSDKAAEMRKRIDARTYLTDKGTISRHPLSQVRKITEDLNKYSTKLESLDKFIEEAKEEKETNQNIIDSIHRSRLGDSIHRTTDGDYIPPSRPYYTPPKKLTDEQKEQLKDSKEIVSRSDKRINQIIGPSYDNLSKYVTKLEEFKKLEIEMPGSTIGYNKIQRTPDGDWKIDETEPGRIVNERARIYTSQKSHGAFKKGKLAEQFLGFNPMYSENNLIQAGVKPEDLEKFMTLPQERLSNQEKDARNRYKIAQQRLEDFRDQPFLKQEDFMRKQTREELVSEVIGKVDSGLLRSNVLPNLAAFLDKTKEPEAKLINIGGKPFVISDPGTTSVQPVKDVHSFADQLSVLKFKQGLEQANRTGAVQAREYFDKQMMTVNDAIAEFELAKKTNSWTGDTMRPWDEELDAKRLQQLYDRKKDIEDFYIERNERIQPTGGVREPVKL